MTEPTALPADWIDGHPQLEAIAAAVWEQCGRSDSGTCVEDDPRNIAVAALAAVLPAPAVLREAAEQLLATNLGPRPGHTDDYANGWSDATLRAQSYLRSLADKTGGQPDDELGMLRRNLRRAINDAEIHAALHAAAEVRLGRVREAVSVRLAEDECGEQERRGYHSALSDVRRAMDGEDAELRRMAAESAPAVAGHACGHCGSSDHPWDDYAEYAALFADDVPAAVVEPAGPATAAQPVERPRCPRCQLPHDLDPDSGVPAACASILASLAEAARLHDEGDHSRCARVDCEVVRERAADQAQQDGARQDGAQS